MSPQKSAVKISCKIHSLAFFKLWFPFFRRKNGHQIIVAARLAKEKTATVVKLLSISLIANCHRNSMFIIMIMISKEPLSFWVHMKLKILYSF